MGCSVKMRVQAAPWALQKLLRIPLDPAPRFLWELATQEWGKERSLSEHPTPPLAIPAPTLHLRRSRLPGAGQRKMD